MEEYGWLRERLRLTPKAFAVRWILALALLLLLALIDQALVQTHLLRQQADAATLNVAGRQRMLCLVLQRQALGLLAGLDSPGEYQTGLEQTRQAWEEGRQALALGGGGCSVAAPSSEALALLERMRPSREALSQAAATIASLAAQGAPRPLLQEQVEKTQAAGDEFLPLMDRLVNVMEDEARSRVQSLRRLELALGGTFLLLLLAMALFLFVPMGRRLRQDLDLLSAAAQEMRDLSLQDGLTGVANRRHLDERLFDEWRRAGRSGQPLSLVILDIDHFKLYNDAHGHQAGDLALVKVAGAAAWAARRAGDLASRYGGEEFVLLLPQTPLDGALALAEQLRRQVRELKLPHTASPVADILTISVGVASYTPDKAQTYAPEQPGRLLEAADRSLYQAKQAGRDRVGPPQEVK